MENRGNNMLCNVISTPIYICPYEAKNRQHFIDLAIDLSQNNASYLGYHSDNQLHKLPEFKSFCDDILIHVEKYLNELSYKTKDGSKGKFTFSRMWMTNYHHGNNIPIHCHVGHGGAISGVYYIELPDDEEQGLRFYHKEKPFLENIPFEIDFSDSVILGNNTLVLFPSELLHSGIPCNSHKHRINLSFNIIYSDNLYGPIID